MSIYQQRGYEVRTAARARELTTAWLREQQIENFVLGLPEVDDRYHLWRVPVLCPNSTRAGEVAIAAVGGAIDVARTASAGIIRERITAAAGEPAPTRAVKGRYAKQETRREVLHGDSRSALRTLPVGSIDLAFTSPPYYNARPEYADYATYNEYLDQVQEVIRESARVLGEGRFFVMNISPVLLRRKNRNSASTRLAVPFDMHRLFMAEGFDFIDHIIWQKPEGAGWATGRGRRFAADRNPLQYKTVPVTEDILVYRKASSRLIDWNIRTQPDQEAVKRSRIGDGYDRTNIWRISPANDKRHPAIFPEALAERVIRYYSFEGDTVLDPYGGLGTAGRVAQRMNRGFVMVERDDTYHHHMAVDISAGKWGGLLAPVAFTCAKPDCHSNTCLVT